VLRRTGPRAVEIHQVQSRRSRPGKFPRYGDRIVRVHPNLGEISLPQPDTPTRLQINRRNNQHRGFPVFIMQSHHGDLTPAALDECDCLSVNCG
jgi:hypothetical protein